jgi:RimJ/RimL family protein N-acetyltransferase
MALPSEAIRLRPLAFEDLPAILNWNRDPEIAALIGNHLHSDGDALQWWEHLGVAQGHLAFAITINGRLVGDAELTNITWRSGEAEVRICIGYRQYWNQGYGTYAMGRLLRHAFLHLGIRQVYLRVLEHNRRAIRSYEKLGFRKVGRLLPTGRLAGQQSLWLMETDAGRFLGDAPQGQMRRAERAVCSWTAEA